jgi:putative selenate reductase
MMNASAELEALRREIPDDFAHFRDLAYRTRISESITLSTFHGCPAEEIERIVHFLLTEMDVHLTVKMNPTLVGRQEVEHLLYDCLGYHDIRVVAESFDNDLKFEEALEICRRLDLTARRMGKRLVVKFSNTLVVRNHKDFFVDEVMYMSGPPLHVIAMNLVKKFRDRMGDEIPISFSAGIDQHNFATAVGLGLAPVTTCTDLLRPGGYGRLHKYMANLESRMKALGVRTLGDYVLKSEGRWDAAIRFGLQPAFRTAYENAATLDPEHFQALWAFLEKLQMELLEDIASNRADVQGHLLEGARQFESELAPRFSERLSSAIPRMLQAAYPRMVDRAGLLNTAPAVERATADPRYSAAKNSAVPKKTSSRLTLYDCINCDKCVPVCPNDGNFIYELSPVEVEVPVYEVEPTGVRQTGSTTFHIKKSHQLANYADFCNECGNCDVFCPEDGGPHLEKPRFFSSEETWRSHNNRDGFFLATGAEKDIMLGRIGRQECRLIIEHHQDRWIFEGSGMRFVFSGDAPQPVKIEPTVFSEETRLTDLRNYWIIRTLYRGILDASHVNLININADH